MMIIVTEIPPEGVGYIMGPLLNAFCSLFTSCYWQLCS